MVEQILKVVAAILLAICILLMLALAITREKLRSAEETIREGKAEQEVTKEQLKRALEDSETSKKRLDDALAWAKANPAPKDPGKLAAWVKELEAKR